MARPGRHIPEPEDYLLDLPPPPLSTSLSAFPWLKDALGTTDTHTDPASRANQTGSSLVPTPLIPTVVAGRTLVEPPGLPGEFFNYCPVRGAISVVMGGAMGFIIGMFLSNYERLQPPALPGQPEPPKVSFMQNMKHGLVQMKVKGKSWARNFAIVGGVFATVECFIESHRAAHDLTNSVTAGCVTGAALSAKGGPAAACLGCAGFAAFSVVIDKFMEPDL